jgi:hypothetical protein
MCFTDASGFVWLQQHTLTKFIIKVICTTTFFYKKAKKKMFIRNATQRCAMQLAATKTVASQQPDQDSAAASDV